MMEAPNDINLTCCNCKASLSRSPVKVIAENKFRCGRCEDNLPNENHFRIMPYETLAKKMKFPCMNKDNGCKIKIPFDDKHEMDCEHKSKEIKKEAMAASSSNTGPEQQPLDTSKAKGKKKCAKCPNGVAIYFTKNVWLCEKCVPKKEFKCKECKDYSDTGKVTSKHRKYFCKTTRKCEICSKVLDEGVTLNQHYEEEHGDITKKTDENWQTIISNKWQWCIIKYKNQASDDIALCRYKLEKNVFTFEVYSKIPCLDLHKYKWTIHMSYMKLKKQKSLTENINENYDFKGSINNWKETNFKKDVSMQVKIINPGLEPN